MDIGLETTILDPSILKFVDVVSCITTPYEKELKNVTSNRVLESCYYLGFDKENEDLESGITKALVLLSGVELSINLRFTKDTTIRITDSDLGYEKEEEEENDPDEDDDNPEEAAQDKKRKHGQTDLVGEGDTGIRFRKKRRGPNDAVYYVRDIVKEAKFSTLSDFTIKRALSNTFFRSVKASPWYYDPIIFHHTGADARDFMDHTCDIITGVSWSGSDDVFIATITTRLLPFYLFVLRKIGSTVRIAGKMFNMDNGITLQSQSEVSAIHEQINNVLASNDKHKRRIVAEIALNRYASLEKGKNAYTIKYSGVACTKDVAGYEAMFSHHECNARLVTKVMIRWLTDNKYSEVDEDYHSHYFTSNLITNHAKAVKAVGDSLLKHIPEYCSWDLTKEECVTPFAKVSIYAVCHKHITLVKHLGNNMNDKMFAMLRKTRTTLDKTKNKLVDLYDKMRKTDDKETREMIEAEIKLVDAEKKALQNKTHQTKMERTGVNSKSYTYQDRQRLATRVKELEASLANTTGEKNQRDVQKLEELRTELTLAEKGGVKKKNNKTISQFFVVKK